MQALFGELVRRSSADNCEGARVCLVPRPRFDLALSTFHVGELIDGQALIVQVAVERFYVSIFIRLPKAKETKLRST
jgi:hypothetical protein